MSYMMQHSSIRATIVIALIAVGSQTTAQVPQVNPTLPAPGFRSGDLLIELPDVVQPGGVLDVLVKYPELQGGLSARCSVTFPTQNPADSESITIRKEHQAAGASAHHCVVVVPADVQIDGQVRIAVSVAGVGRVRGIVKVNSWATAPFPDSLYGNWYNDADGGSWQWGITGTPDATTIRTWNRFFSVAKTYGHSSGEFKVLATENGRWFTFFYKNITPNHMEATFPGCPDTLSGFDTEAEAFDAVAEYSTYCSGNHR